MARSTALRLQYKEAFERLNENAVDEATAFIQMGLSQLTFWDDNYLVIEAELKRLQQNPNRTFIIARKLEDPRKLSIYMDECYEHHSDTDNSRINDKRKKQEKSLRKRINDYSSNKESKFSVID